MLLSIPLRLFTRHTKYIILKPDATSEQREKRSRRKMFKILHGRQPTTYQRYFICRSRRHRGHDGEIASRKAPENGNTEALAVVSRPKI